MFLEATCTSSFLPFFPPQTATSSLFSILRPSLFFGSFCLLLYAFHFISYAPGVFKTDFVLRVILCDLENKL